MDVSLGCCGVVIAILCIFFGMTEVGLWVACYFECTDGKLIEFNYFAAVWTGVLAFTVGFMIIVLFCVKFKSLGTFIVILTFLLVPCEIICACLYAYRAYESRDKGSFDVLLFGAMSVCGVFLFLFTIMWNCYYCCVATPVEDFEEEVKEDLEEENERQRNLQAVQHSVFVNNPVVDDESRPNQTRPLRFGQPRANEDSHHVHFPQSVQNGYPQAMPPRQNGRYPAPNSDIRRDDRNSRYPQSQLTRGDYPYPAALNREPIPEERNRRNRQQSRMPRPFVDANHQSYIRNGNRRGQDNRAYEPDELGQPVDRSYNLRSYIYDGRQGDPFDQPIYLGGQQPQGLPNNYDSNPSASADYGRNHNESRRHVNRPPNYYPQQNAREPAPSTQPRDEDRAYIYRPRPENYRGKPAKPEYMQRQQQRAQEASSQNPTSRESAPSTRVTGGPVDSYF